MVKPLPGDRHFDVSSGDNLKMAITKRLNHPLYEIVQLGNKSENPVSHLSNGLSFASLATTVCFVKSLFDNAIEAKKRGQDYLVPAWLFAASQVFENGATISDGVWRLIVNSIRSTTPRPTLRVLGHKVPIVDVFVTCCGEQNDIVIDTLKAACAMDYPISKFRVICADDGKNPRLKKACGELVNKYTNLVYYSRQKPDDGNHGYKAGNLNVTWKALGTSAEFLACFDADMIPEPGFLRALLPHALIDDKVGMVTCAQHHYNIPDNDPLYQSNITGTGADDGIRDSVNASWCPGSGFIIRKTAWKEIGEFPTFSITEDLITSWMLHGKGWKIVLVHEYLQWGLQPDCLLSHLKQRRRWWAGHVRDGFTLDFSFDKRLWGATLVQRVAMFHHCCRPYLYTVWKLMALMLILLALIIPGSVVPVADVNGLWKIVLFVAVQQVFSMYADCKSIWSGMFWNLRRRQATNAWLGIHFTRDVIGSMMPKTWGGLRLGFEVSGTDSVPKKAIKERYLKHRPEGMWDRLALVHHREGIMYHGALVFVFLCAIILCVWTDYSFVSGTPYWLRIMAGVGFTGHFLIAYLPLHITPMEYMMYPPTMPTRRRCMVFEQPARLWRAAPEFKGIKWTRASWWLEIPHSLGRMWLLMTVATLWLSTRAGAV
ncbi:glycosyl transferase [Exophiala viscosa]|uniref:glycosyl transferase n=1 Tax=Exophiala viscosa TaxID=2486360 RepID=UPI002192C73A|nr:glycosyl transferase [Exophiala viscosa]